MIDMNVQKSLGDFQISAKIGLESDGVIALFGRSGSGKTSLVNMIAGLTTPDSGTISIAGKTLFDSSRGINVPPEQRSLGYVFQEDRLFPHMSVASNLSYGMPKGMRTQRRRSAGRRMGPLRMLHCCSRLCPLLSSNVLCNHGGCCACAWMHVCHRTLRVRGLCATCEYRRDQERNAKRLRVPADSVA